MAGKLSRVQHGRRILTPEEARERGAIELPPGLLQPGQRRLTLDQVTSLAAPEMIHRRTRECTDCGVSFTETIIAPVGEAPKPRDKDERPDLCANCFKKLNRFPILGARKPKGIDAPRRI